MAKKSQPKGRLVLKKMSSNVTELVFHNDARTVNGVSYPERNTRIQFDAQAFATAQEGATLPITFVVGELRNLDDTPFVGGAVVYEAL